jgi:hypothetical protein
MQHCLPTIDKSPLSKAGKSGHPSAGRETARIAASSFTGCPNYILTLLVRGRDDISIGKSTTPQNRYRSSLNMHA